MIRMKVVMSRTKKELGEKAAEWGAAGIREAIRARGLANIVIPTGASQFEMIDALVNEKDVDWGRVAVFHLDEYVGLPITHPASFRKFLRERFIARLPGRAGEVHEVNGEGDPHAECERLKKIIGPRPIDVAFVGIGENGHLAFNDPPADFQTPEPYLVVDLDEACRRQQVGEGWYKGLEDVPKRAISMSIQQILKAKRIVCSVPDQRKAKAVQGALEGPVTPMMPSSILQKHEATTIYLEPASASLLKRAVGTQ
jgi:glucosamine-6-phosphate deaminase